MIGVVLLMQTMCGEKCANESGSYQFVSKGSIPLVLSISKTSPHLIQPELMQVHAWRDSNPKPNAPNCLEFPDEMGRDGAGLSSSISP
ncbi:unnamed protein product [Protopolystoma xenopodis]|uniref:Uncharacterized protein n=1 Tax=Protopolystoma xenopodis TaxID=117903 RepID=A0A3S5CCP9_9PLAT|nr:unnamed protein product [Protopolystoma xenopodis]